MKDQPISSPLASLIERLQEAEALDLEFKAAQGGLPRSLWETVCAFANTHGGWIVLGIGDRDRQPVIEGVQRAQHLVQTFYDGVRNAQKISEPVCGPGDVSVQPLEAKHLVVIRVPPAARFQRPVFINGNPYTGTYVRRASGDFRCTRDEVNRMIREKGEATTDTSVLVRFGLDDLDRETLQSYRRRLQTLNVASPWNSYDDRDFLRAVGGMGTERDSRKEGLTVAGLLMFGSEQPIREWRNPHLIDYRLVLSDSVSDRRWDDRLLWEGNLLSAFDTLYRRLTADLPVPFRLEGAIRIDEGPEREALREALVNLLAHADYAERAASHITRSRQGYLFRNPGRSRIPTRDLLSADNRSDPRNPEIVRMFRLIGLADQAGSGLPKILRAWRLLGFQMPEIDSQSDRYEFTLRLRYAHLLAEADRTWLHVLGSDWSEAEQLALVLARRQGWLDNVSLREVTGQHPADITKVLGGLRDRGMLQMIGARRGARYELGPAVERALRQAAGGAIENPEGEPRPAGTLSLQDSGPSLQDSGAELAG